MRETTIILPNRVVDINENYLRWILLSGTVRHLPKISKKKKKLTSYVQSESFVMYTKTSKFTRSHTIHSLLLYKTWNKIFIHIPLFDVHENKSFVPLVSDELTSLPAIQFSLLVILYVGKISKINQNRSLKFRDRCLI